MRDEDTFVRSVDGTDELRRRGLEDDTEREAGRRIRYGGVLELSFETGGRAAELFGVVRFCLPRELAELELSNDDDSDWPRRIVAE